MACKRLNGAVLRILLLAGAAGFVHEAAADIYRYTDDRGRVVHGSNVPPQFVKNGYEVLNDRGQVIRTVPRALTPAELAAQEATRAQREAEEALLREQQEKDNLLLRLYRSPEEIGRKRDERVVLIDGQLTALQAALTKVEDEVARLQKVVDDQVAAGGQAPEQTVETLRIQNEEMTRLVGQRTRLENDKATTIAEAERDMKRLSELLGLTEDSTSQ